MDTQDLLKLISLLLQYPDQEIKSIDWQTLLADIDEPELTESMNSFGKYFHQTPLVQLQENYVHTFDFNDKTNLYLTYSKLGDEKERGQTLAELKEIYMYAGFEIDSTELPDYLPLLLEFVAHADEKIRTDLLRRFRETIEYTQQMLSENESPYSDLLKGLLIIIDHFILKEVLL
jgi:nitrate reductase delta subunit